MKHPEITSTLRALTALTSPAPPRSHFAGPNMYLALITIAIPSDALRGRRCPKCPESHDHPRAAFQFVLLKISGSDASGRVTSTDDRKFPSIELAEYRQAKVGRARVWNVVVVAVLAGGFTVSAIGARALYRSVQTQAKSSFETSASDVSAAVSSSLREDIDFVDTQARSGRLESEPDQSPAWNLVHVDRYRTALSRSDRIRVRPTRHASTTAQLWRRGRCRSAGQRNRQRSVCRLPAGPEVSVLPATVRHRHFASGKSDPHQLRFL